MLLLLLIKWLLLIHQDSWSTKTLTVLIILLSIELVLGQVEEVLLSLEVGIADLEWLLHLVVIQLHTWILSSSLIEILRALWEI
jgi:hypothetical protein